MKNTRKFIATLMVALLAMSVVPATVFGTPEAEADVAEVISIIQSNAVSAAIVDLMRTNGANTPTPTPTTATEISTVLYEFPAIATAISGTAVESVAFVANAAEGSLLLPTADAWGRVRGTVNVVADPSTANDSVEIDVHILPLRYQVDATGNPITVPGTGEPTEEDGRTLDIVLPTSAGRNFDFALDPSGITQAVPGANFAHLQRGLIVPDGAPFTVINNSSFPILVGLEMNVVVGSDADVTLTSTTTVAEAGAATTLQTLRNRLGDSGTAAAPVPVTDSHNAMFYIVPAAGRVADPLAPFVPSTRAFLLDETSRRFDFFLPAATYNVGLVGDVPEIRFAHGSGNGQQFQIGGFINPNISWDDFAAVGGVANVSLGITSRFVFDTSLPFDAVPTTGQQWNHAALTGDATARTTRPPVLNVPFMRTVGTGTAEIAPANSIILDGISRMFLGWEPLVAGFGANATEAADSPLARIGVVNLVQGVGGDFEFYTAAGVEITRVIAGLSLAEMPQRATEDATTWGWYHSGTSFTLRGLATLVTNAPLRIYLNDGRVFSLTYNVVSA